MGFWLVLAFKVLNLLPSKACGSFCVGDLNYLNTSGINVNYTWHSQKVWG